MKTILTLVFAVAALAGCAVVPVGPPVGVYVQPAPVVVYPYYGYRYYGPRGYWRR